MHVTMQVTNSIQVNLTNQPSNSQVAQVSKIILHLTRDNIAALAVTCSEGLWREPGCLRFMGFSMVDPTPVMKIIFCVFVHDL